jgi:phage shock protein A
MVTRFTNLVRAMFGGWVRKSERRNPAAVYEQAIEDRARQYRELKEAVAGILYMRNKLEAEIHERRIEVARVEGDVRNAVDRGRDDLSLTLIEHKQRLAEDLERAERELDAVRCEADEAKTNLLRFREELRSLARRRARARERARAHRADRHRGRARSRARGRGRRDARAAARDPRRGAPRGGTPRARRAQARARPARARADRSVGASYGRGCRAARVRPVRARPAPQARAPAPKRSASSRSRSGRRRRASGHPGCSCRRSPR